MLPCGRGFNPDDPAALLRSASAKEGASGTSASSICELGAGAATMTVRVLVPSMPTLCCNILGGSDARLRDVDGDRREGSCRSPIDNSLDAEVDVLSRAGDGGAKVVVGGTKLHGRAIIAVGLDHRRLVWGGCCLGAGAALLSISVAWLGGTSCRRPRWRPTARQECACE
jgi:hypothetical protein